MAWKMNFEKCWTTSYICLEIWNLIGKKWVNILGLVLKGGSRLSKDFSVLGHCLQLFRGNVSVPIILSCFQAQFCRLSTAKLQDDWMKNVMCSSNSLLVLKWGCKVTMKSGNLNSNVQKSFKWASNVCISNNILINSNVTLLLNCMNAGVDFCLCLQF